MRLLVLLLLIAITCSSCKEGCKDGFTTVADLDSQDLVRCNTDQRYVLMKYFSGGFDSIRKARGIPSLPKDFMGVTFTVPNQIRWINEMGEKYKKEGKPYYHHKGLEWEDSTLMYDKSSFVASDSLESGLLITFKREAVMGNKIFKYVFEYGYHDKTLEQGTYRSITKEQADSILNKWDLHY